MTDRPHTPLRHRLRALHARLRGMLVLRHALRASAAAMVLLAAAVISALALPRTPLTAMLRLGLFVLGSSVALVAALVMLRRESPTWASWLESLETRFPELRSWLRTSLDLEATPDANTSRELADAVRDEAAKRLAATPLDSTLPSVRLRAPLVATLAATLSLIVTMALAPVAMRDAWHTLWTQIGRAHV